MKNNKKGFTLVELLAVIVILAIVMLIAVTAIGPVIENSRKSSFESTARIATQAAENYVLAKQMTDPNYQGGCVKISELISSGFFDNKGVPYDGSINITTTNGKLTYTIYLSNGSYYIIGKTADSISATQGTTKAKDNCAA